MKHTVGVPIAFDAEAWCLLGLRRWTSADGRAVCVIPLPSGVKIVALRSGVGLENGLEGARWLVREGVQALVSVGFGGGLHPALKPGSLIVGTKIIEEGNGAEPEVWGLNPACTKPALAALRREGIPAQGGAIVSVRSVLFTPEEKAELYRKTDALVSDMESGSIARTAAEANLPFLALRVVIDPVQRKIEPDLSACLDERGKIRFLLLWRNLSRRPSLAPEMARMTGDLVIALSALRRAWSAQTRYALPAMFT
jgi:adenosylhomocysteine nucleosidase